MYSAKNLGTALAEHLRVELESPTRMSFEKSAMDAPMYVKSRAVMVRARFLRPQGSLCDRCATALRAALDLGASAGLGQAEAGAGSACPKSAARRRRLALELAK